MKGFLYQCLLISTALVAAGCAGPESYMSHEERLLAHGYPPEYVAGVKTGYEEFRAERVADKGQSTPPVSEVKVERAPEDSKAYQQGRDDGKEMARRHVIAYRTQLMHEGSQMMHTIIHQDMQLDLN